MAKNRNGNGAMANRESILQSQILAAIGARPGCVFMRNSVVRQKLPGGGYVFGGCGIGSADIIGCVYGRFVGIEVKTDTGRLSKEQKQWAHRIREYGGGIVVTVRSVAAALAAVDEWVAEWAGVCDCGTECDPLGVCQSEVCALCGRKGRHHTCSDKLFKSVMAK